MLQLNFNLKHLPYGLKDPKAGAAAAKPDPKNPNLPTLNFTLTAGTYLVLV